MGKWWESKIDESRRGRVVGEVGGESREGYAYSWSVCEESWRSLSATDGLTCVSMSPCTDCIFGMTYCMSFSAMVIRSLPSSCMKSLSISPLLL